MKIRNTQRRSGEEIELQMTPMIDIVFQLLVFFIMTFKIIAPEGDFNIKMPLSKPSEGPPKEDQLLVVVVRLHAHPNGDLRQITFGKKSLGDDFNALQARVRDYVGDNLGAGSSETAEVELDCDYNLHYEYVIEAITAVSGYHVQDGQDSTKIVKLIENIKFARPRNR